MDIFSCVSMEFGSRLSPDPFLVPFYISNGIRGIYMGLTNRKAYLQLSAAPSEGRGKDTRMCQKTPNAHIPATELSPNILNVGDCMYLYLHVS